MSAIEALEFLEFNTIGAGMGPTTPVWVDRMTAEELRETYEG